MVYAKRSFIKHPEKEVLVIRTERIWEDAANLNLALAESLVPGGSAYNVTILHNRNETGTNTTFENVEGHRRSWNSEKYAVKSGLSKEGREFLCCFLSDENQIFEDIVLRAGNIDEREKEEYLGQLYNDCRITLSDREKYRRGLYLEACSDQVYCNLYQRSSLLYG